MVPLLNKAISSTLLLRLLRFIGALLALNLLVMSAAQAMPSFSRQTGADCASCHVGAFGPQLTPYGMNFKLRGYADGNSPKWLVPLSGMVVANWTHNSSDLADPEHFKTNNNAVLQEVSLFVAGKLAPNLGAFVQTTYSGVDLYSSLDQADIRLAHAFTVNGKELTAGVSLNNNPSLTNPTNTMGAWRFPFTAADLTSSPTNTTMLDDMLGQQVVGLNAYGLWDQTWYAELGGYRSLSQKFLGRVNDLQDVADDVGRINGLAPYWRLGYQNNLGNHFYTLGLFGMDADIKPDRTSGGPYDKYRDVGVDGSYQFLGDPKNVYTLNGSYTHETRSTGFSGLGNGHLNRLDLNASYFYDQTYGVTAGLFDVRGNTNISLWDTPNGKPDSNGYVLQVDWTPFGKSDSWLAPNINLRLGLQYTYYNKFDGSSQNASDNNSLSAFAWTAF